MKENIARLKSDIKKMSHDQKVSKICRKTDKFPNDVARIYQPVEAQFRVMNNRVELRHMYIAYGHLRGKTLDEVENSRKTPVNTALVDKIVEQYYEKEAVCADS